MGISDHLTCFLRNLYTDSDATVRTGHGTMAWFKIWKSCILSLCLIKFYAEYIMQNARLDKAQARFKISGRNINNLRYSYDTTVIAESEEQQKSLLMKVKEESESEKVGLKLNIQKTKIMASGSITSWQIVGETMDTVIDFIFLGSKITVDSDCSHEFKKRLLLRRKAMTHLDSVLNGRDITFLKKPHIVKAVVFPVVVCGYVSWTIKNTEW